MPIPSRVRCIVAASRVPSEAAAAVESAASVAERCIMIRGLSDEIAAGVEGRGGAPVLSCFEA